MKNQEALSHILQTVEEKQNRIREKFPKTRLKARGFKLGIVVFSLTSTVLIGLDIPKLCLVISSSLVVASSLIDGIMNYSDKSVQEHSYYLKLSILKERIIFYKNFTDENEYDEETIRLFFDEYNTIRKEFHLKRIASIQQSFDVTIEDTH